MSTNARSPQERTAVRPRTIHLGIDGAGDHHIYRTQTERVHVVDPDAGRVHVERLRGRPVEDWIAYVTDRRQWRDRRFGLGLVEMLSRATEAEADGEASG